jgi:diguanylate cyclase (GGDEF)-like protein/PAS domain S-box-containing protein
MEARANHGPLARIDEGTSSANAGDTSVALRALTTHLDGVVFRARADCGWAFEYLSAGCRSLTGYSSEELIGAGRSFESLLHTEDREMVHHQRSSAVQSHRSYEVEYRIHDADGLLRWISERGAERPGNRRQAGALLEGVMLDITARKLADLAAVESERRYRGLFDHAIEGIFLTTLDGRYIAANPALARIYGFQSAEQLIESLRDIGRQLYIDPTRRDEFMCQIRARGSVSGFESQVTRRDGTVIWISENARAVNDAEGNLLYYEGTVEDITERKLYEARLERQANYDALTGLANRSLLNDRLEQAILAAGRNGGAPAVVYFDLDRFKFINDSLGHPVGDELLRAVGQRLCGCVREGDTVARLGGDEFVILVNGHGGGGDVQHLAERVLRAVAVPWTTSRGTFNVSCSVGVALYPHDGQDAATLLKHADSAMYRAKELGRNGYQFFTPELNERLTEKLAMQQGLSCALQERQFELYYQPRVLVATGEVLGVEALLRWHIPGQGLLEPDRFIPIAEETGLILPIGRWVLEQACRQALAWQRLGLPLAVSVNVSAVQFQQQGFAQLVADTLRETQLPARRLELELTESLFMQGAARMVDTLRRLKELGLSLAIDDFGTGYSSLSYLKRFAADRLKIDRSFIHDLEEGGDDAVIARTIISLGRSLGLRVVAEGVETAHQLRFLRENGCDEAQGFLYGRPMCAEELAERLRRIGAGGTLSLTGNP